MLIEFTVGNFRSFKEPVTLSMVAANIRSKYPNLDKSNVFAVDDDFSLLKTAAIYGANASGKSNIALAMRFVRSFALTSSKESQIEDKIPVEPFRLESGKRKKPSYFQIVFVLKGKQYRYGFEVNSTKVISEWLYFIPSSREALLFERRDGEIKVSPKFKEGNRLESKTRENALFLSVVAQFNGEIATSVLKWFASFNLISGLQDHGIRDYTIRCFKSKKHQEEILKFVKELDLGIEDIQIEDTTITLDSLPVGLPEKLKAAIIETTDTEKSLVKTSHLARDSKGKFSVEVFSMEEHESEGTKKLFAIAGPLMDTLKNGKLLFIDEMDARLHPMITLEIIKLFHSTETNPRNAQLIFVTHDTNLLSNKRFRRDQIWFCEKDRSGSTRLYSLVEYKVRSDASFESDYIHGRYGAVPYLGDFSGLLN
jgi:uncharacterized protein